MREIRLLVLGVLGVSCVCPASAKNIKIHGYVTAVKSPTEFEIDDYRIMRDISLTLEFEKSDDPEEKTTFKPEDIRVGTELEIHGELDESSNLLTAKTIKVHLEDYQHVKRTALIEVQPELRKVDSHWEGQVRADGQRLVVDQSTAVTIRLNSTQKKAAKENAKAAKKKPADPKVVEEDEEPGIALKAPRPDKVQYVRQLFRCSPKRRIDSPAEGRIHRE
jgi:hypothetical protein